MDFTPFNRIHAMEFNPLNSINWRRVTGCISLLLLPSLSPFHSATSKALTFYLVLSSPATAPQTIFAHVLSHYLTTSLATHLSAPPLSPLLLNLYIAHRSDPLPQTSRIITILSLAVLLHSPDYATLLPIASYFLAVTLHTLLLAPLLSPSDTLTVATTLATLYFAAYYEVLPRTTAVMGTIAFVGPATLTCIAANGGRVAPIYTLPFLLITVLASILLLIPDPINTVCSYVLSTKYTFLWYTIASPTSLFLTTRIQSRLPNATTRRKLHHFSILLLLLPGVAGTDVSLYFAVAGCLLMLLEVLRYVAVADSERSRHLLPLLTHMYGRYLTYPHATPYRPSKPLPSALPGFASLHTTDETTPTICSFITTNVYAGMLNDTDLISPRFNFILSPVTLLYGTAIPLCVGTAAVPTALVCVSDSAAAVVGSLWGRLRYDELLGEGWGRRTVEGSLAFFACTLIGVFVLRWAHDSTLIASDLLGAAVVTVMEAVGEENDNIILGAVGWLWWGCFLN